MSQASPRIYSTTEVAHRLGVSPSLLRRFGLAWERVQGETLPQLPGLGRLYPEDVVEALEEAKAWMEIRPEAGVEEALRAVLGVSAATQGESADLAGVIHESVSRALSPLLGEIRSLKAELRALEARLGESAAAGLAASYEDRGEAAPELGGEEVGFAERAEDERAEEDWAGDERAGDARAGDTDEVIEAEIVEDEPAAQHRPMSRPVTDQPATDQPAEEEHAPRAPAASWDFAGDEPPRRPQPVVQVEARQPHDPDPWPAPWRVQPRAGEAADEGADGAFDRLEDDFASEQQRDDERDKGFVNWFKRNF